MPKRDLTDWSKYWITPSTTKKHSVLTKAFLEKDSEEKNWKTRINTDDFKNAEELHSVPETGGLNLSKEKESVRSFVLDLRINSSREDLALKSSAIFRTLAALECYRNAVSVALYSPVRNEVDTSEIFSDITASGREAYFPVAREGNLVFRRVSDLTQLSPGAYGIPEPPASAPEADVSGLDLILIPGVAFDVSGNRIGYGKGYYDRALSVVPRGKRIALAYGFQVLKSVPRGEHDLGCGMVITESGAFIARE